MFNNLQRGHLATSQRAKQNQENEGCIQLINNKGMVPNQQRVPGSFKQVFGDVKNKIDTKSNISSGAFPKSSNISLDGIPKSSPLPTALSNKFNHHGVLKTQRSQCNAKNSPFPSTSNKWVTQQHETYNPQSIEFHDENEEFSLDIDSLLDTLPIPKPKPDNYGYSSNLFNFTNDEINDVMFQNIDQFQDSPKLYNDDFNLREIPILTRELSFESELPLCMTPDWETGNNSIMDLFGNNDKSSNSFSSIKLDPMDEDDELPDFFTFKID